MIKKSIFVSAAAIAVASLTATLNAEEPYPFGNPVIRHMYTADAAPKIMPDGRVWMVTSVDHEDGGGYSTMHSYSNFSSADMLHWHDHGTSFRIEDVNPNEDPTTDDWALWAPDMVYRDGKYYLYYPIHIRHRKDLRENGKPKVTSYIGVAVSDSLDKPFEILNAEIEGTPGIDPSVFIDDDDQIYLYWGQKWVARLKDNMYELAEPRKRMSIGDEDRFNGKFMEAPWMHKRDGRYYYNYHTVYNGKVDRENPDDDERKKSRLDYSWGEDPMGPLEYAGTLNYELGVNVTDGPKLPGYDFVPWRLNQSNHGGVVEFHKRDFLFYHTSALSSWRKDRFQDRGSWTQRSVCVDEIFYNADGSIIPVAQTLTGPTPVVADQPFEILLGSADLGGKSSTVFESVEMGTGYYYLDTMIENPSEVDGKLEVRIGSEDGYLAGTITLSSKRTSERKGLVDTFLREADGTRDLYLVHKPDQKAEKIKLSKIRLFAGAPKPL